MGKDNEGRNPFLMRDNISPKTNRRSARNYFLFGALEGNQLDGVLPPMFTNVIFPIIFGSRRATDGRHDIGWKLRISEWSGV
jgi:hypothetical protein